MYSVAHDKVYFTAIVTVLFSLSLSRVPGVREGEDGTICCRTFPHVIVAAT